MIFLFLLRSYVVQKARRVDLVDMQKWDKESDCSILEYSSIRKNRGTLEQHWQSLHAGLFGELRI